MKTQPIIDFATPDTPGALVEVRNLSISFPGAYGNVSVVDDLSFVLPRGSKTGLVGESGSGKTLVGLALLGLLPNNAATEGAVHINGSNILGLRERERAGLRGSVVSMIYQDALSSLNPNLTVARQLNHVLDLGSRWDARDLLHAVHLESPNRILASYPHQLSGGERQRVLIAIALARDPALIVADEPTTALDVTIERQISELLIELSTSSEFSLLLISHDLALVSQLVDRVMVMYAGQLDEITSVDNLLNHPRHRYSRGLVDAARSIEVGQDPLATIKGAVPSPFDFGPGCRFLPRCDAPVDACSKTRPPLDGTARSAHACHNPQST